MSVRDAITVIGTAIGAYFGNPQLGYAIGSAIGNAVDPQTIKGPSLGDMARQTAMEGVPRPIVWALSPPIAGNIIASSEPKIVRKRQRQGKGGPKVQTEHVYRTYAVGVCEGPITRFVRVWRNNTLVFDVSEFPLLAHEDNVKFMEHARFFLGTFTQEPSPNLEAVFGVGTTPSHQGTAYMVMDDEELTDLRGAIPQYIFQVERCEGFFLTSRPYAIEDISAVTAGTPEPTRGLMMDKLEEGVDISAPTPLFGELFGSLETYNNYPDEAVEVDQPEPLFGEIFGTLELYDDYPPEGVDVDQPTPLFGELFGDLIMYDDYPPEAVDVVVEPLDGELT